MYQPSSGAVRIRRDRGIIRPVVTGGVFAGVLAVAASIVGLDLLHNPISTETVDHSPPPILTELRDLAEFHAARASFEVVVDQEQDVNLVPQFLAGERVQFVAVGSVDAVVDFTGLTADSIVVDEASDGGPFGVTITLPAATLDEPQIDPDLSHVMNRDRGLVNRLGGALVDNPTSEHDLLLAASAKMSAAAARTEIVEQAQSSTVAMLTGMLRALGYDRVTVVWDAPT